ncbi:hypothetical protein GCM10009576_002850 [Streptomyces rhizosphaericus]|uniref:Uncharacterized protein n=2 Tax=Streptomyces rhizosphaericus TaxID=114699 RepID=A0ABP3Z961_9ACTN
MRVTAVPGAPETVNAPLPRSNGVSTPQSTHRRIGEVPAAQQPRIGVHRDGTADPGTLPVQGAHSIRDSCHGEHIRRLGARDGGDIRAGRVHPQMKPALRRRSRWQPGGIERNGHQVVPGDAGQRHSRRDEHGGALARRHMTERVHQAQRGHHMAGFGQLVAQTGLEYLLPIACHTLNCMQLEGRRKG